MIVNVHGDASEGGDFRGELGKAAVVLSSLRGALEDWVSGGRVRSVLFSFVGVGHG